MKISITLDINNCYECPFQKYVSTHGFCANVCALDKSGYACTPREGMRDDCPFKTNEKGIFKFYK